MNFYSNDNDTNLEQGSLVSNVPSSTMFYNKGKKESFLEIQS